MFKLKKNSSEEKIKKSKEIIKEEKRKIKEEKKKIKSHTKKKPKKHIEKEIYTSKEVAISIVISMILGAVICISAVLLTLKLNHVLDSYKDLSKLIETYKTITNNYYGDIDKKELIDTATNAMMESVGDNFTTYSNSEKTESFLEDVEGSYEGIGCTVTTTEEGKIKVVSMFDDSPAKKAGLKENDIILAIDGTDYQDKTSNDVAEYVKNSKNKTITLKIKRNDKEKKIKITRTKIDIPVVSSNLYEQDNHKIGYISISIFSKTATEQFKNQLEKLEKENIEGLVIDVRNDGGGYLSSVTEISSMFLAKGKVIYKLESEKEKEVIKDKTKEKRTYPIAILINEDSASASEILASAIKESYNGLVVGVNSYGKGTVQQTKQLKDGSMIKYTTQKWLTPNGNWINETGVEPTNKIELDTNGENDNQLQEAIKLVVKKLN